MYWSFFIVLFYSVSHNLCDSQKSQLMTPSSKRGLQLLIPEVLCSIKQGTGLGSKQAQSLVSSPAFVASAGVCPPSFAVCLPLSILVLVHYVRLYIVVLLSLESSLSFW